MDYKSITLRVPQEQFDLTVDRLFEGGALGTEVLEEGEEVLFKVYAPANFTLPQGLEKYVLSESELEERDWNSEWKKYYRPVKVSERIWVVPSWEKGKFKEPEGSVVIYIYPGRGFGTGTHETTRLVMRFLEEVLKPGVSFLDVGTGSGILSILAKKLGAEKVVACDVQEGVDEEVERNAELSGVSGIEFVQGSVDRVSGTFNVVAANIEKHLLTPLLEEIYRKTEEFAVFSGILKSQREEFLKELERVGFKPVSERGEGEWIAFLCRK